jgi:ABC-type antimicrobial peptide transport system permease subunit
VDPQRDFVLEVRSAGGSQREPNGEGNNRNRGGGVVNLIGAGFRKSVADVTKRKGRTLLVVLGIFIGVVGLVGINVTQDTMFSAVAFTIGNQTNQPDVVMNVDRLDPALLPTLRAVENAKVVQYETDFLTLWRVSKAPGYASMKIVSYPDLQHAPLTPFELVSGRYPGAGEIVMEYGDTALQSFGVGDMVTVDTIQGTAQLKVVGLARTSGINPATTEKAQGYMSAAGIEQLAAFTDPNHPNQPTRLRFISVKLNDVRQSNATSRTLQQILSGHGVNVLVVGFPALSSQPLDQMNGVFTLLLILVGIALLISFLLISSAVATLITEQTSIVGTMKAIGGTRRAIVRGYLVTVGIYATLATVPGILLGVVGGYQLAAVLAASIPLALGPFAVQSQTILLGLLVGFGVPLIASLVPLWNGTRITVREALAAYGVSAGLDLDEGRSPKDQRVKAFVLRPSAFVLRRLSQTARLGLRGLFRKPWRVALTVLTLTMAGICFLVVQTVATSVNSTVGAAYAHLDADVEVDAGPQTSYRDLSSQLLALPNVLQIERYGVGGANSQWGRLDLWGIEPTTRLYRYQLTSGRWMQAGESDVVLLSDDAAQRTGLRPGSTLEVSNATGRTATWTVIGTVKQQLDSLGQIGAVVVPVETAYRFLGVPTSAVADTAQRLMVQTQDRSPAAVSQLTFRIGDLARAAVMNGTAGKGGGIANVFLLGSEAERHQRAWLPIFLLLYGLALVVGAAAIVGLANERTASVLERQREIGMLRAMGAGAWRVTQVFWIEGLALGGIAWLIGTLLGLPLAYLFLQVFGRLVAPADLVVDPVSFLIMLVAIVAVATLATVLPTQRAARMPVREMLSYE